MNIQIVYGREGARDAVGTVVIIDVFRAATVASTILALKALSILPVATPEEAFAMREKYPGSIITGEERGIMIEGFDVGNSPSALERMQLEGKRVIQRTSAGTQGLTLSAVNLGTSVNEIYFGAFTTLSALAEHIREKAIVTIVAMDGEDTEDGYFARCLKRTVEGEVITPEEVRKYLTTHPKASHFFDKEHTSHPVEDFDICVNVDRYDFVVQLKREGEEMKLVRVE